MTGVFATYNRDSNEWSFSADYGIREVPVYISITGKNEYMTDARMGFVAVQGETVLKDYAFPENNQRLISSDQPYQGFTAVEIPGSEEVNFVFFFEEDGERAEQPYSLTPKTSPYPEDGGEYYWDYEVWAPVE